MNPFILLIESTDNEAGECVTRGSERGHPARLGDGIPPVVPLLSSACGQSLVPLRRSPVAATNPLILLIEPADNDTGECGPRGS